jgi:hypothetical protein
METISDSTKEKLMTVKYPTIEIVETVEKREIERVGKTPIQALAVGETETKLIIKVQTSDKNFPDGKHYIIRVPQEMFSDIIQTMEEEYKHILQEDEV